MKSIKTGLLLSLTAHFLASTFAQAAPNSVTITACPPAMLVNKKCAFDIGSSKNPLPPSTIKEFEYIHDGVKLKWECLNNFTDGELPLVKDAQGMLRIVRVSKANCTYNTKIVDVHTGAKNSETIQILLTEIERKAPKNCSKNAAKITCTY